jgi:glycosyltransferase involved in cell wall biosynthesis
MNFSRKYRIAVVHDDFIQFGGAENLIFDIAKKLNSNLDFEVVIFSSLVSPKWKRNLSNASLKYHESFLRHVPFCYLISKLFFIPNLFYLAFQSFNFDGYDVVFSSSTRFGHSVITKPSTYHISYLNSPSKMLWSTWEYFKSKEKLYRLVFIFLNNKRVIDQVTQNYSDLVISNSKNIRRKVAKFYRRNSLVLYPFIDSGFMLKPKENYYVLVSRLVSWKRIDYAIKAFNELGERLVIIGSGPQLSYLKKIANPNIEFTGFISESAKRELISKSTALIFPQNEDFGLTVVESLCLGTPVIYFNKGGAREILNESTGVPFEEQRPESLVLAVNKHKIRSYSPEDLLIYGAKFNSDNFIKFITKLIITRLEVKKS